MCEILTALSENNISMSVRYYGSGDLLTGWEVKEIVDNVSFFDAFYTNYSIETIGTLNDYIIYLFLLKFRALEEILPLLQQDEHKEVVSKLSQKASIICNTVDTGNIVRFINTHIEEIFEIENHLHDIRDVTLELIKKYSTGIDYSVYTYLCSNHYYLVIGNFDSFFKIIKSDPTLFEKIYPTGRLSDLQERRFKETLDIFASILCGASKELKTLVNERVSVLCADVESLVSTITEDNVMLCEGTVREFLSFLKQIKHPKANDFDIHYKTVEKVLFNKIHKSGQHSQYEIPVEEIIQHFSSIENWAARLISLTHSHVPSSGDLKSRLSFERDDTHSLMDLGSTNIPTDGYFTFSHQMMLSVHASVGAGTMVGIISRPEVYQDYAKLVMSAILFISEQMQREDEHLFHDWVLLDRMLKTIMANREMDAESIQPLCYSAAMFTCSFTEKMLRLFYVDKVKDQLYVPVDKATLGQLLTESNTVMVDTFDLIHIKHLAFFLSKCGDKKIGHNYRNRIAHWTEMENSNLTISLVAELLWLFTDVLNTIFAHYLENIENNEVKTEVE